MSSRPKLRSASEVCADCGTKDANWASVNRGVFICDECCSIHRSLGRHISQVKSLRKGQWNPAQLNMVHHLVNSGANSIWEYALIDPNQPKQQRKKPTAKDPLHPTKADFIRAKYHFLAYLNKSKDAESSSIEDLSQQLHSSVRTANLETSLRLLSLGADPNYFHSEKGNCPLHVAAQSGQNLQVELLVVYGADPGAFDSNGKTPVEHAKQEGHQDLADRIIECQYELTDTLAFYLCGRKPDHRAGQHFIIPEMADSSVDMSELAKAAKKKLQALPNRLFEELAMDVYDEVDRRMNDQIWQGSQASSAPVGDRQLVAFLPVNPEFSSTRNQGRQKLARFNAREFATLIIDILSDAKRRQQGASVISVSSAPTPDKGNIQSKPERPDRSLLSRGSISDDEPLYDSVASDEDYASIADSQSIQEEDKKDLEKSAESVTSSDQSDGPITLEEYLQVKRELVESRAKVQQLQQQNKDLRHEITLLQSEVQRLVQENQQHATKTTQEFHGMPNGPITDAVPRRRPVSMIEPRDQRQQTAHRNKISLLPITPEGSTISTTSSSPGRGLFLQRPESGANGESDYDNDEHTEHDLHRDSSSSGRSSGRSDSSQATPTDMTWSDRPIVKTIPGSHEEMSLPPQEDIVKKTEKITKKIQELLRNAQEGKQESYSVCAEKIVTAVNDMARLFPQKLRNDRVCTALQLLINGAMKLKEECAAPVGQGEGQIDAKLKTQQVIQCAYQIAKAEKELVVLFE